MIRAVIVDDEEPARLSLRRELAHVPDLEIVAEAANGLAALEALSEHQPDVIFLDIHMPGLSGLEVIAQAQAQPLVVFITAYDEYAVQAFEAQALDYLLKPLRPERVQQTLVRVRQMLARERPGRSDYEQTLRELLSHVQAQQRFPLTKLAVQKNKRLVLLPLRAIICIGVTDTLVFVHTATERCLSDKTISELETLLGGVGFFRINRGELINLEHLTEIIPWFSGTAKVRLSDGRELEVSRERYRQLKKLPGLG